MSRPRNRNPRMKQGVAKSDRKRNEASRLGREARMSATSALIVRQRDALAEAITQRSTCGWPCEWCGRKYLVSTEAGPDSHHDDCAWIIAHAIMTTELSQPEEK